MLENLKVIERKIFLFIFVIIFNIFIKIVAFDGNSFSFPVNIKFNMRIAIFQK